MLPLKLLQPLQTGCTFFLVNKATNLRHNDLHTNCPPKAQSHFIVFGHVGKALTNDSPDLPQMCNFVPQIVARQL